MHNGTQVIVKTKILPSKFTTFCFSFISCHPIIQSCSNNHVIVFRHSYSKANQEDKHPKIERNERAPQSSLQPPKVHEKIQYLFFRTNKRDFIYTSSTYMMYLQKESCPSDCSIHFIPHSYSESQKNRD